MWFGLTTWNQHQFFKKNIFVKRSSCFLLPSFHPVYLRSQPWSKFFKTYQQQFWKVLPISFVIYSSFFLQHTCFGRGGRTPWHAWSSGRGALQSLREPLGAPCGRFAPYSFMRSYHAQEIGMGLLYVKKKKKSKKFDMTSVS